MVPKLTIINEPQRKEYKKKIDAKHQFAGNVCIIEAEVLKYIKDTTTGHYLPKYLHIYIYLPTPIAQVVERPLREQKVLGQNHGRAIPKALNCTSNSFVVCHVANQLMG